MNTRFTRGGGGTDESSQVLSISSPGVMFANVFPSPYIDILRLFSRDWSLAELSGDVQQNIDKVIGKRVFAVGGITAAANYLALPRPSASARVHPVS